MYREKINADYMGFVYVILRNLKLIEQIGIFKGSIITIDAI